MRGGWIEILCVRQVVISSRSHPMRGGWIEIVYREREAEGEHVPPHAGWVD